MDINFVTNIFLIFSVCFFLVPLDAIYATPVQEHSDHNAVSDGAPVKKVLTSRYAGENLLDPNAWRPWQKGFERKDDIFICDNAFDVQVQRGILQTVALNQKSRNQLWR